ASTCGGPLPFARGRAGPSGAGRRARRAARAGAGRRARDAGAGAQGAARRPGAADRRRTRARRARARRARDAASSLARPRSAPRRDATAARRAEPRTPPAAGPAPASGAHRAEPAYLPRVLMRLLALSIGIALLCTTGAEAQDDAAGRARRLFELGVAAMDRRQPGEAAQHFDESYRLFPRASTACNMALAQEQLGQPCAARRWYEQGAAIDPEGDKREHANAQIARLAPLCSGAETPVHDPFVRAPSGAPALTGSVQVVEAGAPAPMPPPSRDRTLLGFGI